MPLIAFFTGLLAPVGLFLLSPFIAGSFGLSAIGPVGRAFLAANTAYVSLVFALTWAFQVSPQLAGPAANVGSIVGGMAAIMILSGKQVTAEIIAVTVVMALVAVWAYYALGRAPMG